MKGNKGKKKEKATNNSLELQHVKFTRSPTYYYWGEKGEMQKADNELSKMGWLICGLQNAGLISLVN